jgi:hypothetical protein
LQTPRKHLAAGGDPARRLARHGPGRSADVLGEAAGALDVARPLEGRDLPACFSVLRRRLEADLGSPGTREYIKALRLMESTLKDLAGAVEQAS